MRQGRGRLLLAALLVCAGLPVTVAAPAQAAPVGQGFEITPSDLAYILKQIKIAEHHAATYEAANPCATLVGNGPDQISSPLLSLGLRTVDGSCNHLQSGQERFGSADQTFPRLSTGVYKNAEQNPPLFGMPKPTSYAQKKGSVFDSTPRVVSNLIVDQTSTNPAAVAAARYPVRTQGAEGVQPCDEQGQPDGCVPEHQTLFIPNVTTDVGLSPPYNSLFTLFGQFFDHGVDQTVKGGGTVFVPLRDDDPLIAGPDHQPGTADDLALDKRFMVLTRGKNQPGPDGVLGDNPNTSVDESADDVQDATNTDSPWVDQSQTYTSHPSHQVFVREYVHEVEGQPAACNQAGKPVATGRLLGGPNGGMATWASVKAQARTCLGLELRDIDALDVPMIAVDPYGRFLPGAHGLPQYVTASRTMVEGNLTSPVAPPADVVHFDTPFLTDIAHHADPSPQDTDHNPMTPKVAPIPDPDSDIRPSPDFANQPPGTYDDEMLNAHFAAGDGRVNENIGLTAIHQIFHSEHNRLVGDIENVLANDTSDAGVAALKEWKIPGSGVVGPDGVMGSDRWNGERIFQAARFINEMEYQHLVFEEFARKIQPAINPFQPFAFTQTELNPAVKAEFAHAVYRFGHSMLTDTISRHNEDGPGSDGVFGTKDDTVGSDNDITLLQGFLNPPEYVNGGTAGQLTAEQAAGSIIMGMSNQAGNELDEFVTETLRNNLLGLPLDLATINLARGRSEGIPSLNNLRRELFGATNDGQLAPYTSWVDFGENLKHPESLINFVAAYGTHPSIAETATVTMKREAARVLVDPGVSDTPPADAAAFMNSTGAWANQGTVSRTGLDGVDLWVGGLAEKTMPFGGLLGSTFNFVFEKQLTDLQNGDRLYYLARTPGMNLRTQLEGNSFAELMMRNTNAHTLKADAFATADCKFEMKNLDGTADGFAQYGNRVANDVASECDETALLIRMADGTIKYRSRNSVDPSGINGQSVYNGTAEVDRMYGGNDNDTFWGGPGKDVVNGGDGADVALGGEGNDILTDFGGDDVTKGGPGNDAIDAGPGLDLVMGGEGKDFTNGGANINETFGGTGDDFSIAGEGEDAVFGDSGDDWQEGGDQPDLLVGDSSNLFFLDDSQRPGHDVLIGQGGDDDYDMEGGDDIGVAGPGIEKSAGASGYDWEIGLGDPVAQDADLALPIPPLGILTVGVRDKFNEVEALSGDRFDDTLRGDDLVPRTVGGAGFIGCDVLDQAGLDRIPGLDPLVPPLSTPLADVVAASAQQYCPLLSGPVWGEGNILLGGGGSDLIEGRGGDDILDGDRYLSVRLSVRTNPADPATEIGSAVVTGSAQSAMASQYLHDSNGKLTGPTLQADVFAGRVDPGNIVAVREILTGEGGTDTALFSGPESNYSVVTAPDGTTTVTQTGGNVSGQKASDGEDTLRNIEMLRFSDGTVPVTTTTTPASAPQDVAATAGDGSATVTWSAPADASASGVTGYRIRSYVGTGSTVNSTTTVGADARSATVTGLTNGTSYSFDVTAVSGTTFGAVSSRSNEVTPAGPPGSPTGVSATGGDRSATVTWTAPASTGGAPITSYVIQARRGEVLDETVTTDPSPIPGTATSAVVRGLTNGVAYTFAVAAVNRAGTGPFSARSNVVTPAAAGPAGDTTAPVVTARAPSDGATGVNRSVRVTATFSEDVVGVSTETFTVRQGTSRPLPGRVTYDAAKRTARFVPQGSNLSRGTTYTVTLTSGIRDAAGNALAPVTWRFTTAR